MQGGPDAITGRRGGRPTVAGTANCLEGREKKLGLVKSMKVELHLHTSRFSPCASNTPQEMMARLIETGYDAVYITEHDAVWPDCELASLQAEFPDMRIFPGVELTRNEEGMHHLLVLGTNDPAYLGMEQDAEILALARSQGHLAVLAHPIRKMRGAPMLQSGLLPDAVECRTGNHGSYRAWTIERMAQKLGLKLVNSGDSHGLNDIDRYWISTHRPIQSPTDIRSIILEGAYDRLIASGQ